MWVTAFNIKKCTDEEKKSIEKVLSDIESKDDSFKSEMEGNRVSIHSRTKDIAYRRGNWMIHNVPTFKSLGYNVYYMSNQ